MHGAVPSGMPGRTCCCQISIRACCRPCACLGHPAVHAHLAALLCRLEHMRSGLNHGLSKLHMRSFQKNGSLNAAPDQPAVGAGAGCCQPPRRPCPPARRPARRRTPQAPPPTIPRRAGSCRPRSRSRRSGAPHRESCNAAESRNGLHLQGLLMRRRGSATEYFPSCPAFDRHETPLGPEDCCAQQHAQRTGRLAMSHQCAARFKAHLKAI